MELGDLEVLRQLRFYLRLSYPLRIAATASGYVGRYPDLPGCVCRDSDLQRLQEQLDRARQDWITQRILADAPIPMPNSHTAAEPYVRGRRAPARKARSATAERRQSRTLA
ncbi:MAG: type II toxin-antitoxin system HicB family antitoxin [Myxococcota bacterium]